MNAREKVLILASNDMSSALADCKAYAQLIIGDLSIPTYEKKNIAEDIKFLQKKLYTHIDEFGNIISTSERLTQIINNISKIKIEYIKQVNVTMLGYKQILKNYDRLIELNSSKVNNEDISINDDN